MSDVLNINGETLYERRLGFNHGPISNTTNYGVLPNLCTDVLQMQGREWGMERQPMPFSLFRSMHTHDGARYRRISHQRQKDPQSATSMAKCQKVEQSVVTRMQEYAIGYNIVDSNNGVVVYSKNLSKEQKTRD
jgi:hypothetical protein